MADSKLENVSSFSFPSNHLLNFQLMRDLEKTQTNKPEYFFFVGLMPGVQQGESRTYDFKSGISLKFAVYELAALSYALKQYAAGNGKHMNYVKFSKSSTGQKILSLKDGVKEATANSPLIHQVFFRVNANNATQQVTFTLDQAYAVGEMLEILYKKAAELEFNRQINSLSYNSSASSNNSYRPAQSKPEPVASTNDAPFDVDDNTSFLGGGFGGFGNGNNPFG